MKKKVKALIIVGSVLTGLAVTVGLSIAVGMSDAKTNGGTISFCAKPIGKTAYQEEKKIKINKHEFTYYNVISGNDGSWILLDKTSYIINTDIQFGFRYKNSELIDIMPYAGSMEPIKMSASGLFPGYTNYNINLGIKLTIKEEIDDKDIQNGVNIGVLMHWCQQK